MMATHTMETSISVDAADDLKPFPSIALKLVDLAKATVPDTNQMIALIECEPAIATQVLSVANSPMYGCTRAIDTIPKAMLILGARSVSTIAISYASKQVFQAGPPSPCRRQLLCHSLGTAVVCKVLATDTGSCDPSLAFLAGMLHDIGKLAFLDNVSEAYESNHIELTTHSVDREESLFGLNHVDIGSRYLQRMGLPNDLNEAVANHHVPNPAPTSLCGIASIATQVSKIWNLGTEDIKVDREIFESCCDFDYRPFQKLESVATESYENIKCAFQV